MTSDILPVASKIADAGLGWAVSVYLFVLLMKEKDKRISEAQSTRNKYGRILRDIRKFVNALAKKANHE